MSTAKPFEIPKRSVWEAFKRVRAKRGAAGVDRQSIEAFAEGLSGNLYKLWNRLSSGSYFPPPVRRVEIPKRHGGKRPLGIPTVADRVAQTVVAKYLEPLVESHFDTDSYGYRPGKSALEAVGVARRRCWSHNWVLDLDIRAFFEHIDHELLLRALRKHTDSKWVLLYVERWLKAPVQEANRPLYPKEEGTPQGGVVSPLLANLFLHYALDLWMRRHHASIPFERYADDVICHCRTEQEARDLWQSIATRLATCGLELNQQKTRIVYCKDSNRPGRYEHEKFDFLGYTFRPRWSMGRYGFLVSFSPAVSRDALQALHQTVRQWRLPRHSTVSLERLAEWVNPFLRGWITYYGRYHPSALYPFLSHLNQILVGWTRGKYRRLRTSGRRAIRWLGRVAHQQPTLFAHWRMVSPPAG